MKALRTARGNTMVETTTLGPTLLAELPDGRYTMEVRLAIKSDQRMSRDERAIVRLAQRRIVAGLVVLVALVRPASLSAADLSGVTLPDRVEVGNETLVLNGVGVRTATVFKVKVYLAGLYLQSRSSDANQILQSTERKRLVLYFFRAADRAQVSSAWRAGLRKNVTDISPLEGRLDELLAALPDLKAGDSVVFDFANDSVDVDLVGGARKSIPGLDFARAMLGIWLGPNAPVDALRAGLLGT
jgi:hypothetical protein